MGKSNRKVYEVRVREQTGPNTWVKKSKFYEVSDPSTAAARYTGGGLIMWVEKVKTEKVLGGVGEFFKLGDKLLNELGSLTFSEQLNISEKTKVRVRQKRAFEKNRHAG